jgi:tetratricopeptide (TPR) repeat protein
MRAVLTGTVTDDGVPQLLLTVAGQSWPAIIDTGFNGELELPDQLHQAVNARFIGRIHVALGGGQHVEEDVYLVDFPCDGETLLAEATFSLGDSPLQVLVHVSLGEIYHAQGKYDRAIALLRRNVPTLRAEQPWEDGNHSKLLLSMRSRTWLVWCLAEVGTFTEGIAIGEGSIHMAETADDPFSLTTAYGGAGMLYLRKGDLHTAGRILERGLEIGHIADIAIWVSWNAATLGAVYALSGRLTEALPLLEQAVQQASSMGLRVYHALQLAYLSEAYLLAGRIAVAMPVSMRALELSRTYKERGSEAWALRLLGEIAVRHEDLQIEQAQRYYRQALTLAEELGMRPLQAHCHFGLGSLYSTMGRQEQARAELHTAIHLYRTMEMTFWLPQAEAVLAQVRACDRANGHRLPDERLR